jgi:hypothetical protein
MRKASKFLGHTQQGAMRGRQRLVVLSVVKTPTLRPALLLAAVRSVLSCQARPEQSEFPIRHVVHVDRIPLHRLGINRGSHLLEVIGGHVVNPYVAMRGVAGRTILACAIFVALHCPIDWT